MRSKKDYTLSIHHAITATTGSGSKSSSKQNGSTYGTRNNRNRGGRGQNNKTNQKWAAWSQFAPSRNVTSGTIFCNAVGSLFGNARSPTPVTNLLSAGTNQTEKILGSHPNILCQICHTPGHSAPNYPNRYTPLS